MNDDIARHLESMMAAMRYRGASNICKIRLAKNILGLCDSSVRAQRYASEARRVLADLQGGADQLAQACAKLRQLKHQLGLRHLFGIQLDVTGPNDHRWLEQTLCPQPVDIQLEWLDSAISRAQRVTGKLPEHLGTADVLTALWEALERGHAA
ncbi:hypothetical protein [Pseudomonas sp. NPDC012596]|uniref:hypothetical protein n=1 Tax=Pseudomonas sp. NPDC012596 TaxID=3364419 RepID=UPI00368CCDEA